MKKFYTQNAISVDSWGYVRSTGDHDVEKIKPESVQQLNVIGDQDLKPLFKKYPISSIVFEPRYAGMKGPEMFDWVDQTLKKAPPLTRVTFRECKQLRRLPESLLKHPIHTLRVDNQSAKNLPDLVRQLPELNILRVFAPKATFDFGKTFPELDVEYLMLYAKRCSSIDNLAAACPKLFRLYLGGDAFKRLPEGVPSRLKNLEVLSLRWLTHVDAFEGPWDLPKLESLTLERNSSLKRLPESMNLPSLHSLTLEELPALENLPGKFHAGKLTEMEISGLPALRQLPVELTAPKLETLRLKTLPKVAQLPDLSPLKNLKTLEIQQLGGVKAATLELPATPKLQRVSVVGLGADKLKVDAVAALSRCAKLQELNWEGSQLPGVDTLPEQLPALKSLTLRGQKDLSELHLAGCAKLESLEISGMQKLTGLPGIEGLKKLETASVADSPKLAALQLGGGNKALTELTLSGLPIRELPLASPKLSRLHLASLGKLQSYAALQQLKQLKSLTVNGVDELPEEIGTMTWLENFSSTENEPDLETVPLSFWQLARSDTNIQVRLQHRSYPRSFDIKAGKDASEAHFKTAFYWNAHCYLRQAPEDCGPETFAMLAERKRSNEILPLIHHLSRPGLPEHPPRPIASGDLNSGAKVWVTGSVKGGNTALKNRLKELGFKVVAKFSAEVDLVVVGHKPKLADGLFDPERPLRFACREHLLDAFPKESRLEQPDAPPDLVANLQRLLWSAQAANDRLALQLARANGIPNSIVMDFLVAARRCRDASCKKELRALLKANVSSDLFPVCMQGGKYNLTPQQELDLVDARFKRGVKIDLERVFSKAEYQQMKFRQELFTTFKPHFLRSRQPTFLQTFRFELTTDEINQLISDPLYAGKLKSIVSGCCQTFPRKLLDHVDTLQAVRLPNLKEGISECYALENLEVLKLGAVEENTIPAGIGALTRLKTLHVDLSEPFSLPPDFARLERLTQFRLNRWYHSKNARALILNHQDFADQLKRSKTFV